MSRDAHQWRLESHVCRCCFSRIVSRPSDDDEDKRLYACPHCGLEEVGHKPSVLCACGTKIRRGKSQQIDAGLRCHENRARSIEFPALFVASINGAQPE